MTMRSPSLPPPLAEEAVVVAPMRAEEAVAVALVAARADPAVEEWVAVVVDEAGAAVLAVVAPMASLPEAIRLVGAAPVAGLVAPVVEE